MPTPCSAALMAEADRKLGTLVVTGSSRGIGAAIAVQAAAVGWDVAVNYASSSDEADAVVEKIKSADGSAAAYQASVDDADQVEAMFAKAERELGPIKGLVNNAGVNGSGTRVEEIDPAVTSKLFAVNILGCFLCAGAAVRRMAKRHGGDGGAIVNISSAASKHGGPGTYVDYAAAKGAVDTFTIGLAKEQADQGIRVNCLRPGITMTELSVKFAEENPDWTDWVMDQVPLKRAAEMDEIARAALFLLSEDASYMTGAIVDASGGWVSP